MSSRPGGAAPTNIQVVVRVRPALARELIFDQAVEVTSDNSITLTKNAQRFSSTYDRVLPPETTQEEVYNECGETSVVATLAGYNNCIFAYGQTGTGKTYTMLGSDVTPSNQVASSSADGGGGGGIGASAEGPDDRTAGVVMRAVKKLFQEARAKAEGGEVVVQVVCSYMEIYNDRLYDLLQPYKRSRDPLDLVQRKTLLEVREDKRGATYVPNVLCVKVRSYQAVLQLLAEGNKNRATRHTEMNQNSSRSHAILQLIVEQWPAAGKAQVTRSKLNFVDLAGSEKWAKDKDLSTDRISELTAINSSLTALATVVAALDGKAKHIPYRASKLTHLLQDSIGGNCRTTVIATLSPTSDAFDESCSTLRFVDRVRNITNKAVINISTDVTSVLEMKEKEILRLRQVLQSMMDEKEARPHQGGGDSTPGPPASLSGSPPGSMRSINGLPDGVEVGGAGGGGGGGGGGNGDQLAMLKHELDQLRRALEAERAVRQQLEEQLVRSRLNTPSGVGLHGGMTPESRSRRSSATSASGGSRQGSAKLGGGGGGHMGLRRGSLPNFDIGTVQEESSLHAFTDTGFGDADGRVGAAAAADARAMAQRSGGAFMGPTPTKARVQSASSFASSLRTNGSPGYEFGGPKGRVSSSRALLGYGPDRNGSPDKLLGGRSPARVEGGAAYSQAFVAMQAQNGRVPASRPVTLDYKDALFAMHMQSKGSSSTASSLPSAQRIYGAPPPARNRSRSPGPPRRPSPSSKAAPPLRSSAPGLLNQGASRASPPPFDNSAPVMLPLLSKGGPATLSPPAREHKPRAASVKPAFHKKAFLERLLSPESSTSTTSNRTRGSAGSPFKATASSQKAPSSKVANGGRNVLSPSNSVSSAPPPSGIKQLASVPRPADPQDEALSEPCTDTSPTKSWGRSAALGC